MRGLILAMVLIGLAPMAMAQDVLAPEAFRDATIAAVRQHAPDAEIVTNDPLSFEVRRAGGETSTMNLDYAYSRYQSDPAMMGQLIDRWSRIAAFGPEQAQARDRIIAVLRDRTTIERYSAAFASAPRPSSLVHRPFIGDLVEVLVFDSAESIQYVTNLALEDLGVTPEEAWALAPVNLPARLGVVEEEQVATGVVVVGAASGIAPSALTFPTFCAAEESAHLQYLVPDREWYMVVDRRTGADLTALRDLMVRTGETTSRTVMVCRDGRLVEDEGY